MSKIGSNRFVWSIAIMTSMIMTAGCNSGTDRDHPPSSDAPVIDAPPIGSTGTDQPEASATDAKETAETPAPDELKQSPREPSAGTQSGNAEQPNEPSPGASSLPLEPPKPDAPSQD